ncbi:unnamed protein product [Prorocentrum cordatum]|uniref:Uncharacterized protein n=1 Tax=Prorocentrum cordatum TaxID=2364126 RepID=A0ABN9RVC6_9DINO|nr:unnamed protein product [Polarella glacialis]
MRHVCLAAALWDQGDLKGSTRAPPQNGTSTSQGSTQHGRERATTPRRYPLGWPERNACDIAVAMGHDEDEDEDEEEEEEEEEAEEEGRRRRRTNKSPTPKTCGQETKKTDALCRPELRAHCAGQRVQGRAAAADASSPSDARGPQAGAGEAPARRGSAYPPHVGPEGKAPVRFDGRGAGGGCA